MIHLLTSANRRGRKSNGLGAFVPLRKHVPVEECRDQRNNVIGVVAHIRIIIIIMIFSNEQAKARLGAMKQALTHLTIRDKMNFIVFFD